MRKRRYSYRQIAKVLQNHFGVRVAGSTVNNFVSARLEMKDNANRSRQSLSRIDRNHKERFDSFRQPKQVQGTLSSADDVQQPNGLKSESPRPFHYDEEERFASLEKPKSFRQHRLKNRNGTWLRTLQGSATARRRLRGLDLYSNVSALKASTKANLSLAVLRGMNGHEVPTSRRYHSQ